MSQDSSTTLHTAQVKPPKVKGWWGYRLCQAIGKICASYSGADYYRKDANSPIIRISHKHMTQKRRRRARQYWRSMRRQLAGTQLGYYRQPAAPDNIPA